jgi:hypothetical protein
MLANSETRQNGFAAMNDRQLLANAPRACAVGGIVAQLRGWWTGTDPDQEYLAASTDLADLERRMRLLDRGDGGPVFETFNH